MYGSNHKKFACNAANPGLIHGLGSSLGEENGYLLQYSCLENSADRGAWRALVQGVAELDMTEQLTFSLSKYSLLHSYFIQSLCMNYFINHK